MESGKPTILYQAVSMFEKTKPDVAAEHRQAEQDQPQNRCRCAGEGAPIAAGCQCDGDEKAKLRLVCQEADQEPGQPF